MANKATLAKMKLRQDLRRRDAKRRADLEAIKERLALELDVPDAGPGSEVDWQGPYLPSEADVNAHPLAAGKDLWMVLRDSGYGRMYQSYSGLRVILSGDREEDGRRWLHLSVSREKSLPSYQDLTYAHQVFLGARLAVQVFVGDDRHVNLHPYVLHLWAPLEEGIIPDFATWRGAYAGMGGPAV